MSPKNQKPFFCLRDFFSVTYVFMCGMVLHVCLCVCVCVYVCLLPSVCPYVHSSYTCVHQLALTG